MTEPTKKTLYTRELGEPRSLIRFRIGPAALSATAATKIHTAERSYWIRRACVTSEHQNATCRLFVTAGDAAAAAAANEFIYFDQSLLDAGWLEKGEAIWARSTVADAYLTLFCESDPYA